MQIRKYKKADEKGVFELMRSEGADWASYCAPTCVQKYKKALETSTTYVGRKGGRVCGFIRCVDDYGFGIYVYDLLVAKQQRGNGYGRKLLMKVCSDFPDVKVYAMSDADGYYEKLGLAKEGSIFQVRFE